MVKLYRLLFSLQYFLFNGKLFCLNILSMLRPLTYYAHWTRRRATVGLQGCRFRTSVAYNQGFTWLLLCNILRCSVHSYLWNQHILSHMWSSYMYSGPHIWLLSWFHTGKRLDVYIRDLLVSKKLFLFLNIWKISVCHSAGTIWQLTKLVSSDRVDWYIHLLTLYHYNTQFRRHCIHCLTTIADGSPNNLQAMSFSRDSCNINRFIKY